VRKHEEDRSVKEHEAGDCIIPSVLVLPLVPFINLREQDPAVTAYLGDAELETKVRFQCDAISLILPDLIPALERALSFIAGQS
jgi:hypothetical protein